MPYKIIPFSIFLLIIIVNVAYTSETSFRLEQDNNTNEHREYSEENDDSILPESELSQKALTEFNDQISYYNKAVLEGDKNLIKKAELKAEAVSKILGSIVNIKGVELKTKNEINSLVKELSEYTKDANSTYKIVCCSEKYNNSDEKKITDKMNALSAKTKYLKEKLLILNQKFIDRQMK